MRFVTQLPGIGSERRILRSTPLVILLVGVCSAGCSDAEPAGGAGGGAAGLGGGGSPSIAGQTSSGVGGGAGSISNAGTGTAGTSTAGAGGGGGSAGTSGTAAAAGTESGGGGGAVEASFDTLKSLIPMHCFGGLCHDLPENPLHLTVDDKLYTTLTTHVTKHCGPVLKPGSPQESALIRLLKGPCGETDRMPFGKCFEDGDEGCVSPQDIAALEQWIAKGAPQ